MRLVVPLFYSLVVPSTKENEMAIKGIPKTAEAWLGFALAVVVVVWMVKKVPQINAYVGL